MENILHHVLLAILWIVWCVLHSVLISPSASRWLQKRLLIGRRYYRIFYNFFALVSLFPVLYYTFSFRSAPLFGWEGVWRIIPIFMGAAALFFFAAGALRYDFRQFIGLRQIRNDETCAALTADCALDTGGVLSIVRHPWYVGGILAVWVRPLDAAAIQTNLIVCGYFIVGALLEERRLKAHFGTHYIDYQRRVSMFIPLKWVQQRLLGKSRPGL
jgi:methanethiol S-methyltransferase